MSPELAAAAFSLTNNQVSDIIEMSYGYYIVKLLEKITARKESFAGPDTKTVLHKEDGQYVTIREILSDKFIKTQLPSYLQKLKQASGLEILDAKLNAMEMAAEAAASNSPAMAPEK